MHPRGMSCGREMWLSICHLWRQNRGKIRKKEKESIPPFFLLSWMGYPSLSLGSRMNSSYCVPLISTHHNFLLKNRGDIGVNSGPPVYACGSRITCLTMYFLTFHLSSNDNLLMWDHPSSLSHGSLCLRPWSLGPAYILGFMTLWWLSLKVF